MSEDNETIASEESSTAEVNKNRGRQADTPGWEPKQSLFLIDQLIIHGVKLNENKDDMCWKRIAEDMQKHFGHAKARSNSAVKSHVDDMALSYMYK